MNDAKENVSFSCQRCLQPIHIDDFFAALGEHTQAELALPINPHVEVDIESQLTSMDHFVPPFRLTECSGADSHGFMLLTDGPDRELFGNTLRIKAELFDTLSDNSEIDHPLCDECTDTLLELMDKQLKMAEDEWNDYNNYLKKLEMTDDVPNIDQLEKELVDLKREEERLLQELGELTREEDAIKLVVKEQEAEKQRLENEEEKYWREYTKHRRDVITMEDEFRSLECQMSYAQAQLDKLKKTNVFNVTFHIWHSGHFGTINNFRLGRLPSAPVDWSEINAAWGQTCLLLSALARKMNFTFKNYRLVPYGNHSHIEVLADGKELPLYGSGGFRFFWDTKFDAAMVAFLDCLQQFKEEVVKMDPGFCLPYRMEKGKIEDSATGNSLSIKIQFNSEEQWTKALKFLLTNLKWGLTWVSSQFTDEKH
ncbi:beclin-1-like protein [Toxorhynchites rutilus septentrionalis]|uniref:beclin-1-like protein n=1 Tax=Toxorhynchites rutilus septentrionalis TaxID=329112 RepID=UPI002478AAE5|nr:beclin-1-like protein [Toxorhynchites rutilus septentrionalis]